MADKEGVALHLKELLDQPDLEKNIHHLNILISGLRLEAKDLKVKLAEYENYLGWTECGTNDCSHDSYQDCIETLTKALMGKHSQFGWLQAKYEVLKNEGEAELKELKAQLKAKD